LPHRHQLDPASFPEAALTAVAEAIPDAVVVVEETGRIVFVNETAERLFGYLRHELIGQPVETLVPAELIPAHLGQRLTYMAAPAHRPLGEGLELRAVRKDGSELPCEISLSPVRWSDRRFVAAFVRDVSERKALDAQRRQLERAHLVESILGALSAIVWEAADPERTRLTFVGGRAQELLGYAPARWFDEGFWGSIVHPEDRVTLLALAEGAQTRDAFDLEYRVVRADGGSATVRDIVTIHRNPDGTVESLRGVLVDVTERRELETRLVQAQTMEAVGQLAGGIAHDFNNLLTIASGHARRLVNRTEDAVSRLALEEILAATEKAAELTRQLLAFARRGHVEEERVALNEVVRGLEPLLRRLLDEDIRLEIHTDPEVPAVHVGRAQLEQLVMNLVLNARDAMPDGGLLLVRTAGRRPDDDAPEPERERGEYALLTVSDTGTGIPLELQGRVFEPFFTTKQPGRGTGLGLASVQGTVESLGGFVELDSEPGRGTTFRVWLPAPAAAARAPVDERPTRAKATVLAVEDEPALRSLVTTVLEEGGYHVLPAGDGREALTVAERHRGQIDLLLTDVVMPEMSGPELVRHLRRLRPEAAVLYMSGYADNRLARGGVDEGQVEIIHKPFDPDQLLEKVTALTGAEED